MTDRSYRSRSSSARAKSNPRTNYPPHNHVDAEDKRDENRRRSASTGSAAMRMTSSSASAASGRSREKTSNNNNTNTSSSSSSSRARSSRQLLGSSDSIRGRTPRSEQPAPGGTLQRRRSRRKTPPPPNRRPRSTSKSSRRRKRRNSLTSGFASYSGGAGTSSMASAASSSPAVYIRDPIYAWLPGIIDSRPTDSDEVTVRISLPHEWTHETILDSPLIDTIPTSNINTEHIKQLRELEHQNISSILRTANLHDYPSRELPLQNLNSRGELVGRNDMADLPFLHEAAILYNLKDRNARGIPYTRVGDIIVAVNPFQWIDGLYSESRQKFYAEQLIWTVKKEQDNDTIDTQNSIDSTNSPTPPPPPLSSSSSTASITSSANSTTSHAISEKTTHTSQFDKLGFDPHVYETSCLAYRGLAMDRIDQTILVSGESGAGKTETVKIVMSHLATIEQSRPMIMMMPSKKASASAGGGGEETVRRVLESSPVFEAFGNARTVRNDNSSRFGKFTKLQFDVETPLQAAKANRDIPSAILVGSTCTTYLLEKSRVIAHDPEERTYHVFYQLLSLPEKQRIQYWTGLKSSPTSSSQNNNNNNNTDRYDHDIDNHDDDDDIMNKFVCMSPIDDDYYNNKEEEKMLHIDGWNRTLDALKLFGIVGDELHSLVRALCVVLQLSNLIIDIDPSSKDNEDDTSIISSKDELDAVSDILGIPSTTLEFAMTHRVTRLRGEELIGNLRPDVARDGRDALAKEIYSKLFDFLVRRINQCTEPDSKKRHNNGNANNDDDDDDNDDHKNNNNNNDDDDDDNKKKTTKGRRKGRTVRQNNNNEPPLGVIPKKFGTIGLLDIFGFENFASNRFEQLCINYANERLQQKYVLDNFRAVAQEYEAEGIEVFDFSLVDNSGVLELLEGKMGLIVSLNEECMRPKGSGSSFVYKLKMVHIDSPHLVQRKIHDPAEFGILHFAGRVTYDASNFLERNTDKLPHDLLECITQSSNALIRDEFTSLKMAEDVTKKLMPRRSTMGARHTVVTKFRSQLTALMAVIDNSQTRYIRCIKPNADMEPRLTDHLMMTNQLVCAGLVTAIAISRETFPNRLKYEVVLERFKVLLEDDETGYAPMKLKKEVEHILSILLVEFKDGSLTVPYACGKTKVYFRAGVLERLETARMEYFSSRAVIVQAWIRSILGTWTYRKMKKGSICIQSVWRGFWCYIKFHKKRCAVIMVQCLIREKLANSEVRRRKEYWAAVIVQTRWRTIKPKRGLDRFRRAALVIQQAIRRRRNKTRFTAKMAICVEEARMDRKLSKLQEQVTITESSVLGLKKVPVVSEKVLEDIEVMFQYLRNEIYTLRGKNSDLRAEITEVENEKREAVNHAKSEEAKMQLSKVQISQITKDNKALTKEVTNYKQQITSLKKQRKAQDKTHKKEIHDLVREFEKAEKQRLAEIRNLKDDVKAADASRRVETEMLQDEVERVQEEHLGEVLRLKDELRKTQDSHHDYLSKLMDVLETTHAAREEETSKITEELNAVTMEKDAQITALKKEVIRLRSRKNTEADALQKRMAEKHRDVVRMNEELIRTATVREERAMKFAALADELERQLSSHREIKESTGDMSRALLLGPKKRQKKSSSSSSGSHNGNGFSDNDIIRSKQLIRGMQEVFRAEEMSHSDANLSTIKLVQEYLGSHGKQIATNTSDDALRILREENEELRNQLENNPPFCRACGFRMSKVMAAGGGHGGGGGGPGPAVQKQKRHQRERR